MAFGDRVRGLRIGKGITQDELAKNEIEPNTNILSTENFRQLYDTKYGTKFGRYFTLIFILPSHPLNACIPFSVNSVSIVIGFFPSGILI